MANVADIVRFNKATKILEDLGYGFSVERNESFAVRRPDSDVMFAFVDTESLSVFAFGLIEGFEHAQKLGEKKPKFDVAKELNKEASNDDVETS